MNDKSKMYLAALERHLVLIHLQLSRNVKTASNPNKIPFTIAIEALIKAKSLVRVRNECSHTSMMKTPDATKRAQPKTLKNISMRLCMGALIKAPKSKQ